MKKISKSEMKSFFCLQVLLFVYSLGGIFSKMAASAPFLSWKYILCYGMVLLILVLYALGWQQIIKRMPLIVAYSSKAVTVIWGVVWGTLVFREHITASNIISAIVIIIGILVVTGEE